MMLKYITYYSQNCAILGIGQKFRIKEKESFALNIVFS